jgi:hypothetical protein
MSNQVWYKLLPKGTPSSSSDQMDDVECPKCSTISELRRRVKKENMTTLEKVETRFSEVYENGGDDAACSPAKLLSACASGGPELPFIIYYPPGSTSFVLRLRVHVLLYGACFAMSASSGGRTAG